MACSKIVILNKNSYFFQDHNQIQDHNQATVPGSILEIKRFLIKNDIAQTRKIFLRRGGGNIKLFDT
jgi:hypothetical protein